MLPWAYTIIFNGAPVFYYFLKIAEHYLRQRFPRSLLNFPRASQLGVRPVMTSILRVGVKRTRGAYFRTVKPCIRQQIILVRLNYLPNYNISWPIGGFSPFLFFMKVLFAVWWSISFASFRRHLSVQKLRRPFLLSLITATMTWAIANFQCLLRTFIRPSSPGRFWGPTPT